jgi:hypothetical protein
MLEPFRAAETAVGQKAMVAKIDAENAEYKIANEKENNASPAKEPGYESKQCEKMIARQKNCRKQINAARAHPGR